MLLTLVTWASLTTQVLHSAALGTITKYPASEQGCAWHWPFFGTAVISQCEPVDFSSAIEHLRKGTPLKTNYLVFSSKRGLRGHGREKYVKEKADSF